MRVIHGVILFGALTAGCTREAQTPPSPPMGESVASSPAGTVSPTPKPCEDPSEPSDAAVEIQLAPAGAVNCKRSNPSPNPVYVCKYTKTVTWTFVNSCPATETVTALIGPRVPLTAGSVDDPLKADPANPNIPTSPKPVAPASSTGTAGKTTITADVQGAQDDCYRYSIGGTHPQDPEIEVRRTHPMDRDRCAVATAPGTSNHARRMN